MCFSTEVRFRSSYTKTIRPSSRSYYLFPHAIRDIGHTKHQSDLSDSLMVTGARGIYEVLVLRRPVTTLVSIALVTLFVGWFSQDFALDASADSLTLENDNDLRYYLTIYIIWWHRHEGVPHFAWGIHLVCFALQRIVRKTNGYRAEDIAMVFTTGRGINNYHIPTRTENGHVSAVIYWKKCLLVACRWHVQRDRRWDSYTHT